MQTTATASIDDARRIGNNGRNTQESADVSSSREDHSGDGAAARHADKRPSLFAGAPLSEPGPAPSECRQLRTLTVQEDAPAAAARSAPSKSAVVWAAFVLLLIAAMFFLLQRWSHEAFGPEAPRSLRAQQRHAVPAVDEASAGAPAVSENVGGTPAQAAPAGNAPIQTERAATVPAGGRSDPAHAAVAPEGQAAGAMQLTDQPSTAAQASGAGLDQRRTGQAPMQAAGGAPVPAAGGTATPVIGTAATATTGAAPVPATGATGAPAALTGAAPAPMTTATPMPTGPKAPQRVPASRESAAPNPNRDVVVRTPESSTRP
ncbi:MAG TPA: hypothetical protein VFR86_22335 [Burkholderiaceae bacterium]|nr:hypothetical protein [Burkholderiaceae bacterium]